MDRFKDFIEEKKHEYSYFFQNIQPDISTSSVDSHVIRNIKGRGSAMSSEESKIKALKERLINEKEETLFFIVQDEAHYAPIRTSLVDEFINCPEVANAENVIILQVSATPYCLVTGNSRVPQENRLNWFNDKKDDSSSNYIGIQNFVDNSIRISQSNESNLESLIPGTVTEDSTFENEICRNSSLQIRLKNMYKLCNQKKKSSEKFPRESRFFGLVYQYIFGLMYKAGINETEIEDFCEIQAKLSEVTKNMIENFDKGEHGVG